MSLPAMFSRLQHSAAGSRALHQFPRPASLAPIQDCLPQEGQLCALPLTTLHPPALGLVCLLKQQMRC